MSKKKKVYEILQEEKSTVYVYVEAESKEHAQEYAATLDYEHWRQCQDTQSGVVEVNIIKNPKKELKGRYVERLNGSSEYGHKL